MNSTNLQKELNLTFQKIGKTVLHLQRMEAMLKFLVSRSFLQGDAKNLKAEFSKNINKNSQKTMGNLVKEYIEKIYLGQQKIDESKFSFQITVDANEEFILERKKALENIVDQRNYLIHHMLSELDQTSILSCQKLSAKLDAQERIIETEYKILQVQVEGLVEVAKRV